MNYSPNSQETTTSQPKCNIQNVGGIYYPSSKYSYFTRFVEVSASILKYS